MIVENQNLIPNTLGIKSEAKLLFNIASRGDLIKAFEISKEKSLPFIPLGEGSNILVKDYVDALVAIIQNKGIKHSGDLFEVEAGESWDQFVKHTVTKNYSGIEALSGIPGKVGASPIQNIGAYGSEARDSIVSVKAYDREKLEFVDIENRDCGFEYRNSFFKKNPERFVITSVIFKLSRATPKIPDYTDVKQYFEEKNKTSPSIQEIRQSIIKIRGRKLPNPKIIPNAGSFFTNPIIDRHKLDELILKYPSLPHYTHNTEYKVSAGWLVEKSGLKGQKIGKIEMYSSNALVLTNPQGASYRDIVQAEKIIVEKVFVEFGIKLNREPIEIG